MQWKVEGRSFEPVFGLTNAAVINQKIVYVERRKASIGCLDLATGAEQWHRDVSANLGASKALMLTAYQGEVMVVSYSQGIAAFSVKDGSHLWNHNYELIGTPTRRKAKSYCDGFFLDGLYWTHVSDIDASQPEKYKYERGRKSSWQGLDPATGKVKRILPYPEGIVPGASCFPDQATVRYFMGVISDTRAY